MVPHIRHVQILNYRSLRHVSVALEAFCVLVGPNGAGKSNFLGALTFAHECVSESVEVALRRRGGLASLRHRSAGQRGQIGIRFILDLPRGVRADYAFSISPKPTADVAIARERCVVRSEGGHEQCFDVCQGRFTQPIRGILPRLSPDRLALYAASAVEEFRPVYDFLTTMRFYSIVPEGLLGAQEHDSDHVLQADGRNAAAVLRNLRKAHGTLGRYNRVCRLLSKIVPGVVDVSSRAVRGGVSLRFKQDVGSRRPWVFDGSDMSDGTLRALGLLLAAYQRGPASLIAIEEPEITVQPAAAEVLVEVLMDVACERQVLVTTHSPDILDHKKLKETQIRVVTMERTRTTVSPVSPAGREAIQEKLYTPGELLRVDELNPDLSREWEGRRRCELFGPPFCSVSDAA